MLQTLATQAILSRYGCVTILNFATPHLAQTMRLFRSGWDRRAPLRLAKDLLRLIPRRRLLAKFEQFSQRYFNVTRPLFTRDDLEAIHKDFDVFICGSDQIWNPIVTGCNDLTYFLDFVNSKPKFALSSSFGDYRYNKERFRAVLSQLALFTSISVRETDSATLLSSHLVAPKVCQTLDPTLLLSRTEWAELLGIVDSKMPERPYILVYSLSKDQLLRALVRMVAIHFQGRYSIIAIDQDPYLGYPTDRHIRDASPRDFVELMLGASFVVTNSFHGTAFAVNFSIPFLTSRPERGVNRINSILGPLGLDSRIIFSMPTEGFQYPEIDFDRVSELLNDLRTASINYIDDAISLAK